MLCKVIRKTRYVMKKAFAMNEIALETSCRIKIVCQKLDYDVGPLPFTGKRSTTKSSRHTSLSVHTNLLLPVCRLLLSKLNTSSPVNLSGVALLILETFLRLWLSHILSPRSVSPAFCKVWKNSVKFGK